MVEGSLREDMVTNPSNPYGLAKDTLRKYIETIKSDISFKWLRLFYMYGNGQAPNSLFSQIEKAVASGDKEFNMSGGEQIRDYLHVSQVAEYIVQCAMQNKIEGIINCCSGAPITVKKIAQNYIQEKKYTLRLNFGVYPYPDYEPMEFWGDNAKLNRVLENGKQ
jgi:dTDP-6-deoxy-L-talose 4-dehydrogenase (NAD+)